MPVTAEDLKFSAELLREKGRPGARKSYGEIAEIIVRDTRHIRFVFKSASNRELPLLMAAMPVMPKHAIDAANFEKSTLKPMIGSGPYVFDRIDAGNSVTFRKNPNWWGKDMPSNRGLYNFDTIRYVYYRDPVTMFEGFKTGQYDVRPEDEAANWASGYDFPAARDGRVLRPGNWQRPTQASRRLGLRRRRTLFADARVRQALGMMFDFCGPTPGSTPISTRAIAATSTAHPFPPAAGQPMSARRLCWRISPIRSAPTSWTEPGGHPVNDGSGRDRGMARQALVLLRQAGWRHSQRQAAKGRRSRSASRSWSRTGQPSAWRWSTPIVSSSSASMSRCG